MDKFRCVRCWRLVAAPVLAGGRCPACSAVAGAARAAAAYSEALRAAAVRAAATAERKASRVEGWGWAPAGVDRWTRDGEARAVENLADAGTDAGAVEEREERRALSLALADLAPFAEALGELVGAEG